MHFTCAYASHFHVQPNNCKKMNTNSNKTQLFQCLALLVRKYSIPYICCMHSIEKHAYMSGWTSVAVLLRVLNTTRC